ncbi:MAG: hypothetical protein CL610_21185 [Anaerolineaceae bacterium]|nr:hypothetical protein [Anaerolineaceae bacterium]
MRYSENYVRECEETEAYAARLMGRDLTEREKNAIWGAGTLTWLEMRVQVPMRLADDADTIALVLTDAADDLESRLVEMVAGLAGMLGTLLGRSLTAEERHQLGQIPTVIEVMRLGEDMAAAAPEAREAHLKQALSKFST